MDYRDASEKCDGIVELIDHLDEETRDKALEFFEDVREKVISIQETINRTHRVSDRQRNAITNWEAGVLKWVHDDDDETSGHDFTDRGGEYDDVF